MAVIVSQRRMGDDGAPAEGFSALAAKDSPAAPVMVFGFIALGGSTWLLARSLDGSALPAAVAPIMRMAAATTALAGIAQCRDRSCPSRFKGDTNLTVAEEVHGVASVATFTAWIAMPIVTAIGGRRLRPRDRLLSLLLGLVTFGSFTAIGALLKRAPERAGPLQRAMFASALAWFPVAATAARAAG